MGAGRVKTFLPDLRKSKGQLGRAAIATGDGEPDRHSLAHDQSEAAELEQVAHDQEEGVEYLFALGRAAREEDYEDGHAAEHGDREVERVVVGLPKLL